MIKQPGGARSEGGTSGNAINGISPANPKGLGYIKAARREPAMAALAHLPSSAV